jgi:hypothetical protein
MQVIDKRTAESMIRQSNGKLFSVTFIKRTNGARRRMTARLGVKQGVTGAGKPFNERDHDLITVHEFVTDPTSIERDERGRIKSGVLVAGQFRHVPVEGIRSLKIGGTEYEVK